LTLLFFSHFVGITIQVIVLHFSKRLRPLVISFPSHFARLLNSIHTEYVEVGLLPELLLISGHLEELSDHAYLPRPVHRGEADLCLKGKLSNLREVNLSQLEQLSQGLDLVLEAQVGLFVHVSEIFHEDRLVHLEVLEELVSELDTRVKLHLKLHVSCDHVA
jgi:hypothetical protein